MEKIFCLNYTFAMKPIATIARKTGTLKATESIRAVGKNITGSVLALVLICNIEATQISCV